LRLKAVLRDYHERGRADRQAPMVAMRYAKRRLTDIRYQQMLNDAITYRVTAQGDTGKGLLTPA
jgi:hypothetical protein